MRSNQFLCATVLLTCSAVACAAEYRDADNLSQAAGMAIGGYEIMLRMRAYCVQSLPEHERKVDRAALIWIDQHDDELKGAESLFGEKKVAEFVRLSAPMIEESVGAMQRIAEERGVELMCLNLAARWTSGESSLAKQSPKASKFLKDYLATHPLAKDRVYMKDDESGCRKQQWNAGKHLDAALPFCACVIARTYELLSPLQLDEMRQLALAKKPLAEYEPLRKIAPDLARCSE